MCRTTCAPLLAACVAALVAAAAPGVYGDCNSLEVDFILLEGDATLLAIEDDIRADLEQVGVTVNRRLLAKDDFNTAMTSGDFNLAFSESWGPPYVPDSARPRGRPNHTESELAAEGRGVRPAGTTRTRTPSRGPRPTRRTTRRSRACRSRTPRRC